MGIQLHPKGCHMTKKRFSSLMRSRHVCYRALTILRALRLQADMRTLVRQKRGSTKNSEPLDCFESCTIYLSFLFASCYTMYFNVLYIEYRVIVVSKIHYCHIITDGICCYGSACSASFINRSCLCILLSCFVAGTS